LTVSVEQSCFNIWIIISSISSIL